MRRLGSVGQAGDQAQRGDLLEVLQTVVHLQSFGQGNRAVVSY